MSAQGLRRVSQVLAGRTYQLVAGGRSPLLSASASLRSLGSLAATTPSLSATAAWPAQRLPFAPWTTGRPWHLRQTQRCYSSESENDVLIRDAVRQELEYEENQDDLDMDLPEDFQLREAAGDARMVLFRSHGGQTVEVIFGVKQYAGDEEDYEEEADSEATQHPFTIRIENKDGSNMYFLCSTSLADGEFLVDYISFMDPHDNSNLTEFEYPGPQFSTLDESVQEGLMVYLSERGINEYLLAYMNLKMEDKENELYTEWLRKLHKQLS